MINQALWFLFLFLSGATIPLPTFPGWLQRVALYVPATYLVAGLERAMVGQESIFHLGANILSLAGCAAVALIISHQLFRWDPGSKAPRRAKLWAASTILPFVLLGLWETHYGGLRKNARADYQYMGHQSAPNAPPNSTPH
jgi:hypothetical protein